MKRAAGTARLLVLAGVVSLAGQALALLFMLHATPYTTLAFVTAGAALILLGMAVFAYATYKDARARANAVSERGYAEGDVIFRQGDPGDCVYVIQRGEVEVVREDGEGGTVVIARLGVGELFGEMALLTDAPRSATVRAATAVGVLAIDRAAFRPLYTSVPALRASLDEIGARRGTPGPRPAPARPAPPPPPPSPDPSRTGP